VTVPERTGAYAALDLGAASGRAVLGRLADGRVAIEELHRFPNRPLSLPTGLHWNVLELFEQLLEGVRRCAAQAGGRLDGIGVDAWAVDYALLDRDGGLLGIPFHYRDARTNGMLDELLRRLPAETLYAATGIQLMQINTSCQLLAAGASTRLETAARLLTIPDLMSYWLCGRAVSERTVASTTQLLGLDGAWAERLLGPLGVPARILPEVVEAGTVLAPLRPELTTGAGLAEPAPVVAVAAHDTASAVVAVPAAAGPVAFISSGTWSLVGMELDAPVTSPLAQRRNLSNEAGACGTTRLLKNVMGLWLLQECRRAWAQDGRPYEWGELAAMASACPPAALIDPDDPALLAPGDMPARIAAACRERGQEPPRGDAELARCVLDSLACKHRMALEHVEAAAGRRAAVVHLVGGGARNGLLCQLTADVLGRPVHAGPAEAAAVGNVMMQALAHGRVGSLAEIRRIVAASLPPAVHAPTAARGRCEELYARFCALAGHAPEGARIPCAPRPSHSDHDREKETGCIPK
jgi:rhamnulokinase